MAEVRRIKDPPSRPTSVPHDQPRPGERSVILLAIALACLAVLVLVFAVIRSRSLRSHQSTDQHAGAIRAAGHTFKVVRILDGDTLVIIGDDDIELTLRLAGIDAPEKDQPFGGEAKSFLEDLLTEQSISLEDVRKEKYGRLLAHAYLNSRWIDLEVIEHGMAWVYPDADSRLLREAEATARSKKLGVWSSESPTPPWEWRQGRK